MNRPPGSPGCCGAAVAASGDSRSLTNLDLLFCLLPIGLFLSIVSIV